MKIRFAAFALVFISTAAPAAAQTIIDDWAKVKAPPAPELKSVTLDAKTAALLLLDFNGHDEATSGPCNKATKPRCLASLPPVRKLLERAREKGVFVVYSLSPNGAPGDIRPAIAPTPDEPIVKSGPDKFLRTDLGELLTGRGIKTVIVAGTASEGAVLDTGTDAALHGMNVVVPVDGMSSTDLYAEQYVAWHFTHAPGVSQKSTLSRTDLIGF
ncbi:MAG TPA: isochorismatase family cysteine hydrolase [Roseiarcus sp.]|nr:isochorismatase family cysteine hydrolase [Roseiarcus sp.]